MTYQNLGFWIGQANDTSGGRHPTGWTSGQRWSETSGEWMVMYDTSQSDLANMTTDRNTWQGRANNAWGTSRSWSVGESWEAAYNRVLPPSSIQGTDTSMGNVGPISRGTWTRASGGYTCPITGNWSLLAEARGSAWTNSEACGGQVRIVWPGGTITGTMTHFRPEPYFSISGTMHTAYGTGFVNAGQTINIEILVNADTSGNQLTFNNIVLRPRFIPVQANPH